MTIRQKGRKLLPGGSATARFGEMSTIIILAFVNVHVSIHRFPAVDVRIAPNLVMGTLMCKDGRGRAGWFYKLLASPRFSNIHLSNQSFWLPHRLHFKMPCFLPLQPILCYTIIIISRIHERISRKPSSPLYTSIRKKERDRYPRSY